MLRLIFFSGSFGGAFFPFAVATEVISGFFAAMVTSLVFLTATVFISFFISGADNEIRASGPEGNNSGLLREISAIAINELRNLYVLASKLIPLIPVWEVQEGQMAHELKKFGRETVVSVSELE